MVLYQLMQAKIYALTDVVSAAVFIDKTKTFANDFTGATDLCQLALTAPVGEVDLGLSSFVTLTTFDSTMGKDVNVVGWRAREKKGLFVDATLDPSKTFTPPPPKGTAKKASGTQNNVPLVIVDNVTPTMGYRVVAVYTYKLFNNTLKTFILRAALIIDPASKVPISFAGATQVTNAVSVTREIELRAMFATTATNLTAQARQGFKLSGAALGIGPSKGTGTSGIYTLALLFDASAAPPPPPPPAGNNFFVTLLDSATQKAINAGQVRMLPRLLKVYPVNASTGVATVPLPGSSPPGGGFLGKLGGGGGSGGNTLIAQAPGYQPKKQSITPIAGQNISISLTPLPSPIMKPAATIQSATEKAAQSLGGFGGEVVTEEID